MILIVTSILPSLLKKGFDDHLLILFLHDSKKLYVDKPCWFFPKSGKTIDFRQNGEKIALLANNNKGQWCLKVGNKLLFVEGLPSGQLDTNLVMSLDNIHPQRYLPSKGF